MRVAIFDFDGTLYAEETFTILMNHLKNHPVYKSKYGRFYKSLMPRYIATKLNLYPNAKMKERSMQFYLEAFEGRTTSEMDTYFEEIKEIMQKDFNPEVIARLKQHQQDNVHILLVSGAYTQFLQRVTDGFSFNHIIGSEINYKDNVVHTKIPVKHVNGTRKTEHLLQVLEGQEIDWKNSYAYGDSYTDLPVLELVGNPVAVKPEEKLKSLAVERNWEIL